MVTSAWRWAALCLVLAGVAGCASRQVAVDPRGFTPSVDSAGSATITVVHTTLKVEGAAGPQALVLQWHAPAQLPKALLALQHGFSRQCEHLSSLAQALAAHQVMTVCVQRMALTTGDDWVKPLARWLAHPRSQDPWDRPLPTHVVVAGHSAGALLALRLGVAWPSDAALAEPSTVQAGPTRRLAGAILFDPVASRQWRGDLLAVSDQGRRPVRAIMASTSPCNARLSAWPGLQELRRELQARGRTAHVGVQLTHQSTHMDAEGPSSDALARWACGGHDPTPENFQALTQLTLQWIEEMLSGPSGSGAGTPSAPWRPIE